MSLSVLSSVYSVRPHLPFYLLFERLRALWLLILMVNFKPFTSHRVKREHDYFPYFHDSIFALLAAGQKVGNFICLSICPSNNLFRAWYLNNVGQFHETWWGYSWFHVFFMLSATAGGGLGFCIVFCCAVNSIRKSVFYISVIQPSRYMYNHSTWSQKDHSTFDFTINERIN